MKVENEHLSDTLVGVNAKLVVQNDLIQDVQQHSIMFKNSEAKREDLRQDIAKHMANHKSNETAW
jgi:predicted nucleotide-binding protein